MVVVTVCVGSRRYVRGWGRVAGALRRLIDQHALEGKVELSSAFCMEQCSLGVTVRAGDRVYRQVMPEDVEAFFACEVVPHRLAPASSSTAASPATTPRLSV